MASYECREGKHRDYDQTAPKVEWNEHDKP